MLHAFATESAREIRSSTGKVELKTSQNSPSTGRNILEDIRREGDGDGVEELPDLLLSDPTVEALFQLWSTVALRSKRMGASATVLTKARVSGKKNLRLGR